MSPKALIEPNKNRVIVSDDGYDDFDCDDSNRGDTDEELKNKDFENEELENEELENKELENEELEIDGYPGAAAPARIQKAGLYTALSTSANTDRQPSKQTGKRRRSLTPIPLSNSSLKRHHKRHYMAPGDDDTDPSSTEDDRSRKLPQKCSPKRKHPPVRASFKRVTRAIRSAPSTSRDYLKYMYEAADTLSVVHQADGHWKKAFQDLDRYYKHIPAEPGLKITWRAIQRIVFQEYPELLQRSEASKATATRLLENAMWECRDGRQAQRYLSRVIIRSIQVAYLAPRAYEWLPQVKGLFQEVNELSLISVCTMIHHVIEALAAGPFYISEEDWFLYKTLESNDIRRTFESKMHSFRNQGALRIQRILELVGREVGKAADNTSSAIVSLETDGYLFADTLDGLESDMDDDSGPAVDVTDADSLVWLPQQTAGAPKGSSAAPQTDGWPVPAIDSCLLTPSPISSSNRSSNRGLNSSSPGACSSGTMPTSDEEDGSWSPGKTKQSDGFLLATTDHIAISFTPEPSAAEVVFSQKTLRDPRTLWSAVKELVERAIGPAEDNVVWWYWVSTVTVNGKMASKERVLDRDSFKELKQACIRAVPDTMEVRVIARDYREE